MLTELLNLLAQWSALDTKIVSIAALAAMSCALPGNFLVLRRQSMMGDALSHAILPGVVVAFLFSQWLRRMGWVSPETYDATWHATMYVGAIGAGVLTALLTEAVQKLGRVEASAALGVVFTSLFALGLLLVRLVADGVDIDLGCVLYGNLEMEALTPLSGIPNAALFNGAVLLVNVALVAFCFKELRISAFDPALATAQGISSQWMHYALMGITAATLVAAFESVGSILVLAMLIVPPATASLLTERLRTMLVLSLVIAAASAVLGHVLAITVPALVFGPLGFEQVRDASTSGCMAVAAGMLFSLGVLFGPRHGLISRWRSQTRLSLRIAAEDVLGLLYRLEESGRTGGWDLISDLLEHRGLGRLLQRLAVYRLVRTGRVQPVEAGYALTDEGRRIAQNLVRSHRLWEAYLDRHTALPGERLHTAAHRVEHYIGPDLQEELVSELESPDVDPHGRAIPPSAEE